MGGAIKHQPLGGSPEGLFKMQGLLPTHQDSPWLGRKCGQHPCPPCTCLCEFTTSYRPIAKPKMLLYVLRHLNQGNLF